MREDFSALDLLSVGGFREAEGDKPGSRRSKPRLRRLKAPPKLAQLLPALAAKMVRPRPAAAWQGLQGWPVRLSWADRGGVPALPATLYDGPLFDGPLFDGPLFDEPGLTPSDGLDPAAGHPSAAAG